MTCFNLNEIVANLYFPCSYGHLYVYGHTLYAATVTAYRDILAVINQLHNNNESYTKLSSLARSNCRCQQQLTFR